MFDQSLTESADLNIRPQVNSGIPSLDVIDAAEITFDDKNKDSTLGSSMVLVSSNGNSI